MSEEPKLSDPNYRDSDIKISVLIAALCAIAVMIALAFIGMSMLFKSNEKNFYENQVLLSEKAIERRLPPAPMLQVNEKKDIQEYRREKKAILNSSAVINEQAGLARISITDAKKHVLARGLMPFGKENAPPLELLEQSQEVIEKSVVVEETEEPAVVDETPEETSNPDESIAHPDETAPDSDAVETPAAESAHGGNAH